MRPLIHANAGKLKVLGHNSDQNLGGRDFDNVLLQRFIGDIAEKNRLDVTKSTKALLRLAHTAERTKKT